MVKDTGVLTKCKKNLTRNDDGLSNKIIKYMESIMDNELGIKETQEFMEAIKAFVSEAKKIMADKKVTFGEALGIMPEMLAVITEGKDYAEIMDEIKDLDGNEAKKILSDLVDTFFAVNE